MQKRTREILAVLLLVVLVLVGVGAMGYYIFIGHNWNVAASHIDDSIGQMDGYTVLLYAGTRPDEGEGESADAGADDEASPQGGEGSGEPQAGSGEGSDSSGESAAGSGEGSGSSDEPAAKLAELLDEQAADLNSVVESYRDKGANVFVIDAGDLSRYTDPFIVAKNGMRIGLLGVGKSTLRSDVRADARYLSTYDVDYAVAVTNDATLGDVAAEGLIGDVSVIVCDDEDGEFPNGRYCGSTYCVSAPCIGQVGVLIISPSGVLSTKTIDGRQDL